MKIVDTEIAQHTPLMSSKANCTVNPTTIYVFPLLQSSLIYWVAFHHRKTTKFKECMKKSKLQIWYIKLQRHINFSIRLLTLWQLS